MGLGIVSLMAHDKVEATTFSSSKFQLTVDTAKWWNDKNYYSTWFERVRRVRNAVQGLSIYLRSKAELITKLRKALEPKGRKPIPSKGDPTKRNPSKCQNAFTTQSRLSTRA